VSGLHLLRTLPEVTIGIRYHRSSESKLVLDGMHHVVFDARSTACDSEKACRAAPTRS
jgi:hypothetical protein